MDEHEYSSDGKVHDAERLKELQALPLERKIAITQVRIIEWYQYFNGNVYVSFSGGKDSTVLLDIVRKIYPEVPAVFSNTGLEYPEIQNFVKSFDNVIVIRPKMSFVDVITKYGYPLFSKNIAGAIYWARKSKNSIARRKQMLGNLYKLNGEKSQYNFSQYLKVAEKLPVLIGAKCCDIMKKTVFKTYEKNNNQYPIVATMAEESALRRKNWIKSGCNAFDGKNKSSQPMSFWTEQDALEYIKRYDLRICSVYGEIQTDKNGCLSCTGCKRTGCMFCAFGTHLEKGETRFQQLARTHPRQYDYCTNGGQWIDNPDYDPALSDEPDELGWVEWNPKQIWVPSQQGLGMGKVFDMVNEIYGKEMMRYK